MKQSSKRQLSDAEIKRIVDDMEETYKYSHPEPIDADGRFLLWVITIVCIATVLCITLPVIFSH